MENILSEIKEEFNFQINNFNVKEITNLSKIIHSVTGNIYFSGVGKSGNIAKHSQSPENNGFLFSGRLRLPLCNPLISS